jgi:hypothetical protein
MIESINIPYEIVWPLPTKSKVVRIRQVRDDRHLGEMVKNLKDAYRDNADDILLALDPRSAAQLDFSGVNDCIVRFDVHNAASIELVEQVVRRVDGVSFHIHANIPQEGFVSMMQKLLDMLENEEVRLYITPELFKNLNPKNWKFIIRNIVQRPKLLRRVYPLYYILRYCVMMNNKETLNFSLWELFFEQLGYFYYMSDDKKVTLSQRFADQDLTFGVMGDEFEAIKSSAFFKELENLEMDVFFTYGECSVCPKYGFCKSFLKFHDAGYECKDFLGAIDYIDERIESIAKLYENEDY